jgi:hypothetical protein
VGRKGYQPDQLFGRKELNSGAKVTISFQMADASLPHGTSSFSSDACFYGKFSEFRVYSGMLSDMDVAADYQADPDIVDADFVLHGHRVPSAAGTGMKLTWGPSATNLALQAISGLRSTAVWDPVSLTPTLQNGRYTVSVPFSNAAAFFRLHAP